MFPCAIVPTVDMEKARAAEEKDSATRADETAKGLSHFLGKVLDQLSLSSWLPSVMLVGNLAILLQLMSANNLDIGAAVIALTRKPLGILVVLLFALVLGAIVTQAFEFEVIRILEGYADAAFPPLRLLVNLRIRRYERQRHRLQERYTQRQLRAYAEARRRILSELDDPEEIRPILDIIEDELNGRVITADRKRLYGAAVSAFDWTYFNTATIDYDVAAVAGRLASFPEPNRIMPTRLGNILRASEDQIEVLENDDLEGFVIRNHDSLPQTLKDEHKDYRTRLDMYCSLTLVFCVLAAVAAVTLYLNDRTQLWQVGVGAAAYVILAFVSYEAAIASARGYGQVLVEMNKKVKELNSRAAGEVESKKDRRHPRAFLRALFGKLTNASTN